MESADRLVVAQQRDEQRVESQEFDSLRFREVLGHFSTGVVVVTAWADCAIGMTVQSVASLSLEPPLLLFCPGKASTTWPAIASAGYFCVNILATDQEDVCAAFARSGGDKFEGISWRKSRSGVPILDATLASIECVLDQVYDGGDHEIAIGRVVAMEINRHDLPLVYYKGEILDVSDATMRIPVWKTQPSR